MKETMRTCNSKMTSPGDEYNETIAMRKTCYERGDITETCQ
jgi:hypothetical protein